MKLIKRKGHDNTVRKVYNDDRTKVYGVVGTVEDLLKEGIFDYCDYSGETWAFVNQKLSAVFGRTREEVLPHEA